MHLIPPVFTEWADSLPRGCDLAVSHTRNPGLKVGEKLCGECIDGVERIKDDERGRAMSIEMKSDES